MPIHCRAKYDSICPVSLLQDVWSRLVSLYYDVVLTLLALELDLDALGRALFLKSGVASEFHILLLNPGKEA